MTNTITWKNKTHKERYLQSLINGDKQEAATYSKSNNYVVGDYINHFKFGLGFVQKVINHSKIEVFFQGSEKVMLQNWQQN